MNDYLHSLPPKITIDKPWEIIVHTLYQVFSNDFKGTNVRHCAIEIFYYDRILPHGEGKEEFFWHIISKDYTRTGIRDPDFKRAKRLPWARPLMESGPRTEIKVFDYDHGAKDKGLRRYIWFENYRYAIVLQKRKGRYLWLTAYYVSKEGHTDLAKRYMDRIKKTATA
jgi:hypothetical protein